MNLDVIRLDAYQTTPINLVDPNRHRTPCVDVRYTLLIVSNAHLGDKRTTKGTAKAVKILTDQVLHRVVPAVNTFISLHLKATATLASPR